ncbi:hypothetical protein Vafri_20650 [Volvox africanus]|uniref:Uncharacterized protein n=1 Tax=Volvox africanus TaxID=51714 RepID=A0A8J4BXA8_9CHLO|nr:hypothetical protein Vafri_20650 [Volvox africanus]
MLVGDGRGGVSGGTLESACNIISQEASSELKRVASDQYYLASLHGLTGSDKPAGILPHYVAPVRTWAGPFVMEGVNAKVVQESNALFTAASYPYGKDFKYYEGVAASGLVGAGLVTAAIVLIGVVIGVPPLRALARRFLPAPGQGPSEAARKGGFWHHELVVVTEEETPRVVRGHCGVRDGEGEGEGEGEGGRGRMTHIHTHPIRSHVPAFPHSATHAISPTHTHPGIHTHAHIHTHTHTQDRRDPGYWSTSRMLLETGLALVLDAPRLAADPRLARGGVMSPAAACGSVLLERLRAAGFSFDVVGVEGEEKKKDNVTKAAEGAKVAVAK